MYLILVKCLLFVVCPHVCWKGMCSLRVSFFWCLDNASFCVETVMCGGGCGSHKYLFFYLISFFSVTFRPGAIGERRLAGLKEKRRT